jgi:hypothetical protein
MRQISCKQLNGYTVIYEEVNDGKGIKKIGTLVNHSDYEAMLIGIEIQQNKLSKPFTPVVNIPRDRNGCPEGLYGISTEKTK